MPDPSPGLESDPIADGFTVDRWLGGRLALVQPQGGHRVGTDAALLAAAAGTPEGRIADVGAGVGAVGLALAQRSERAFADLIEIDPDLARLAGINAARNGLQARARVLRLDVLRPARATRGRARRRNGRLRRHQPAVLRIGSRSRLPEPRPSAGPCPPAGGGRRDARSLDSGLARPARARRPVRDDPPPRRARRRSSPRSRTGSARSRCCRSIRRPSAGAHRLLISGVKGSKAPLRIAPPLILHEADGRLTAEADAIHRGEALVDWGA